MSSMRNYQRCANCIMDTTDSKIVFYSEKVCDFCNDYKKNSSQLENWRRRQQKLNGITKSVRDECKNMTASMAKIKHLWIIKILGG